MTDQIEAVVSERKSVHGDWTDTSDAYEALLRAMSSTKNWEHIPSYQKSSLREIAHKAARILSGDSNFEDHWKDIEGYARIVRQRLPVKPAVRPVGDT